MSKLMQNKRGSAHPPNGIRRLVRWLTDCFWEQLPGAKPTWKFIREEARGVKRGWVLLTCIVFLAVIATAWLTHRIDKRSRLTPRALSPVVQVPYREYDEREWPPLTDFQTAEWVRVLGPLHPKSIRIFWGQEVEAKRLFRSIQEVGKQINCEVTANGGYADKPQITIHTRRKNNLVGPALVTLLTEYQEGGPSVPVVLEHPDQEDSDSDDTYKLEAAVFVPECPRHQTPAPDRKTSDRRKDIKKLAEFMDAGRKLENRFSDAVIPSGQELHDWGQVVLDYLDSSEALGDGYVARFNSADSQPGLERLGIDGRTLEESERWKWTRKRNATLRDFIKELQH